MSHFTPVMETETDVPQHAALLRSGSWYGLDYSVSSLRALLLTSSARFLRLNDKLRRQLRRFPRVRHVTYPTDQYSQFPCCPLPNPFKSVKQGSVGLVSRFGQFYKSVDPGLVKVNVCSEQISIVGRSTPQRP